MRKFIPMISPNLYLCACMCLCLSFTNPIDARVVNMFTSTTTDFFGNTIPQTSFLVPNRGPNGWNQLLGSATDQAISYNTQPMFSVELKGGDSVRDMNNPNVWYKTNMGGQLSERCTCPGQGIPCSCHKI
jgi:hypothetical protein